MSPNESISCTDELAKFLLSTWKPASPPLVLISSPCMLCTACWLPHVLIPLLVFFWLTDGCPFYYLHVLGSPTTMYFLEKRGKRKRLPCGAPRKEKAKRCAGPGLGYGIHTDLSNQAFRPPCYTLRQ